MKPLILLVKSISAPPERDYEARYRRLLTRRTDGTPEAMADEDAAIAARLPIPQEPTSAQIKAGNYPKRKVAWHGLTISIENEPGSVRRGSGWATKMLYPYGYINRTEGRDGDQVDVYLGPDESADTVYVVHQRRYGDWERYDEDKCMLNFQSENAARTAYLKHYDDPRFLGPITAMPVDEFVTKVKVSGGQMVKSQGNPNHDPKSGQFASPGGIASSSEIESLAGAEEYYRANIAGVWSLTINRKAGVFRVRVNFNENAEHAYTKENKATGKREFEPVRARLMQHIIGAIATPDKILMNGNRDLFIEKIADGHHYAVVLEWKDSAKEYRFRSAHYWDKAEFDANKARYGLPLARGIRVQKNETPIRKSVGVSNSTFPVCDPSRIGSVSIHTIAGETSEEPGGAPSEEGSCWPRDEQSISYIADLVKTLDPKLEAVFAANSSPIQAGPITIVFPNGNSYALGPDDYSLDDTLAKADLAPGQRWITVHGNGEGKGTPVLVQETQKGSGVFHVVGGAGGKLNYLKLRGIKPESSYKEHAAEKAKARTEAKKQAAARDKELGIDKGKGKARDSIKGQRHDEQRSFIKTVAEKMGWKEEDLQPKIPEATSVAATKKLEMRHHAELLKRANEACNLQRQRLLMDTEARQEAGPIVEPNENDDSTLSMADLDDSRPQEASSLGFAAHYAERAAEHGATEEVIKKEADAKKEARQATMTDSQRAAIKTRGDTASQVKAEIAAIRDPVTADVKASLVAAKDAVDLLKAQKKLKVFERAARAASKDIDEATEVKAYNLDVSAPDEADIAEELENDLRTIRTKAFLATVDREAPQPEKQLRQHIGAGAFNSINGLALTAGGAALVDRSVVDVLGIDGAAQVLVRRLATDLTPEEMERYTAGMEDYHLHHYMETSKDAMREAQELHDAATEIQLGEASHGDDFEAARELNQARKQAVEEAHKILGTALGEMEANAALVTAMKAGKGDKPLEVPLGKVSDEDAIRQARAIGLQRGDYSIDRVAGNQVLTVTPQGMDRLAKPVDREELARTRNTLDILAGGQDEDDWLPQGFAKRPDLALDLKPGVAPSLAQPFSPGHENGLEQSLRDYIGGRAADGDSPAAIVADIQSADFFAKAGDQEAYRAALDAVAPLKGEDGKMARAESLTDAFNGYADQYVDRKFGGKVSTLQRQQFEPDHVAQEALHRALADEPNGIAAYKPIGELSHDDQRALREYFYRNVAHEDPQAAKLRERLEQISASEPEKESVDMFGETAVNPEWHEWKAQRDTLAEEVGSASLDWQKYAGAMNGHTNSYAAIQDLIRSKVGKAFHENYNKLNPGAPLKLGRQVLRNNLNHLDAVDPQARAAREAQERELIDGLRERNQGKYAAGSVSDKLDDARAQKEAFEQSQMGFFSTEQEPDMFGGDDAPKAEKPLAADERYTLGHAAERTIGGMMGVVGQNFKPGQPLKIFNPTMSGPDGVMRQRAIKIIAANKRIALAAGVGCVYGGTLLKCEKSGVEQTFYEWWLSGDIPVVKALASDGEIVQAKAETPVFIKGYEDMFVVRLASGESVIVTGGHRFLNSAGKWVELKSLRVGDRITTNKEPRQAKREPSLDLMISALEQKSHQCGAEDQFCSLRTQISDDGFHRSMCSGRTLHSRGGLGSVAGLFLCAHQSIPPRMIYGFPQCLRLPCAQGQPESNLEPSRSIRGGGEAHSCRREQDCQVSCSVDSRRCGGQPHHQAAGAQVVPTSLGDALGCDRFSLRLGVQAQEQEHSPLCREFAHRSRIGSCLHKGLHVDDEECCAESSGHEQPPRLPQDVRQSLMCSFWSRHKEKEASACQCERACSSAEAGGERQSLRANWQPSDDLLQAISPHELGSGLMNGMPQEHLDQSTFVPSSCSPIVEITSCGRSVVFDITIGGYHNYFAHGILHHNSGKSAMMLGAFSHLQSQGKAKRGLFLVPSIVQGQMGAEALRFMEPGKYHWHCEPGASRDERIAAYKDAKHHFCVMTHQSFRDDMLHLGAQRAGIAPEAMSEQLDAMQPEQRSAWMKDLMGKEGIDFDYTAVDEGHNTLNRQGKENSSMANVIDSATAGSEYYVSSSADVIKNDLSEAADVMRKMDQKRYGDTAAFMRRYGINTEGSKEALKREMLSHVLPFKLEPKVRADRQEVNVDLSEAQRAAVGALESNIGKARMARMEGKVDIAAVKAISPESFKDAPEEQHEAIAKELTQSLGILKGSAMRSIIDSHPDSAKIEAISKLAGERKGKPGVVFAHSLAAVENIKKRLEADGHRVGIITGGDSSADKAAKIQGFNPDQGDRQFDIMVASDAGATGANLQSGQWLAQMDTPMTAMTWRQRQGRIHRIGQKNDVELLDLIANHPSERKARERLKTKDALRDLMTSPMEGLDDSGLAAFLHQRKIEQQAAMF